MENGWMDWIEWIEWMWMWKVARFRISHISNAGYITATIAAVQCRHLPTVHSNIQRRTRLYSPGGSSAAELL